MKITAVKQQIKNPNRVSIFVDGKYAFSLTIDQLLNEKLKKDQTIEAADLRQLIKLSEEGKVRTKALEWLLRRPHSERELRDYLYRNKVDRVLVEALIEEFTQKKYLDDNVFGRWYAENRLRKGRSMQALRAELRAKGVSQVTIQSIVNDLGEDNSDNQTLQRLVNKLRTRARYTDDTKLTRYLLSKGFNYYDIQQALTGEPDDL